MILKLVCPNGCKSCLPSGACEKVKYGFFMVEGDAMNIGVCDKKCYTCEYESSNCTACAIAENRSN